MPIPSWVRLHPGKLSIQALMRRIGAMVHEGTLSREAQAQILRDADRIQARYPAFAPIKPKRIRDVITATLHGEPAPKLPTREPEPLPSPARVRPGGTEGRPRGTVPMAVEDHPMKSEADPRFDDWIKKLHAETAAYGPTHRAEAERRGLHLVTQRPEPVQPRLPFDVLPEEGAPRALEDFPGLVWLATHPKPAGTPPLKPQPIPKGAPKVTMQGHRLTREQSLARRTGFIPAPEKVALRERPILLKGAKAIQDEVAPLGVTMSTQPLATLLRHISQVVQTGGDDPKAVNAQLAELKDKFRQDHDVTQLFDDLTALYNIRKPLVHETKAPIVPKLPGDPMYGNALEAEAKSPRASDQIQRADAISESAGRNVATKPARTLKAEMAAEQELQAARAEPALIDPTVTHVSRGISSGKMTAIVLNSRETERLQATLAQSKGGPIVWQDKGGRVLIRVDRISPLTDEPGMAEGAQVSGVSLKEPKLQFPAGEAMMQPREVRAYASLDRPRYANKQGVQVPRPPETHFIVRVTRADKATTPGVPPRVVTNPPRFTPEGTPLKKLRGKTRVTLPAPETARGNLPYTRAYTKEGRVYQYAPTALDVKKDYMPPDEYLREDTGRRAVGEESVLHADLPLEASVPAGEEATISRITSKVVPPGVLGPDDVITIRTPRRDVIPLAKGLRGVNFISDKGRRQMRMPFSTALQVYERLTAIPLTKRSLAEIHLIAELRPYVEERPPTFGPTILRSVTGMSDAEMKARYGRGRAPARMAGPSGPGSTMVGGPNVRSGRTWRIRQAEFRDSGRQAPTPAQEVAANHPQAPPSAALAPAKAPEAAPGLGKLPRPLKGLIPSVMLGGVAASLLGGAPPPGPDQEAGPGPEGAAPPPTGQALRDLLQKTKVTGAALGPSPALLQRIGQALKEGAQQFTALDKPWRQAMDFALGLGVGAATGDMPSSLAGSAVIAAAEPRGIPIQPTFLNQIPVLGEIRGAIPGTGQTMRDVPRRGPDAVSGLSAARRVGVDMAEALQKAFEHLSPATLDDYRTNVGGGGGRLDAAIHPFRLQTEALQDLGLLGYFRDFVDMMGAVRQPQVLQEHFADYTRLAHLTTSVANRTKYLRMANEARKGLALSAPRAAAAVDGLRIFRSAIGDDQFRRLMPAWDAYQKVAKGGIEWMWKAGLLDEGMYNRYMARPFYIPLHRIQGEVEMLDPVTAVLRENLDVVHANRARSGAVGVKEETALDQMIGSLKPTQDPIEALYNIQENIYREVARNLAGKSIANAVLDFQSQFPAEQQQYIRRIKPGDPVNTIHEGVISYLDRGIRKDVVVPKALADVANFIQPDYAHAGFKTLNLFRRLLQATATGYNLAFMVKNVPRDIGDAILNLKPKGGGQINPKAFLGLWGQSFKEMIKGEMTPGGMWERWLNAGGDYSTPSSHLSASEEMLGSRPKTPWGNIRAQARHLLNASEKATKLASFKTLVKSGMSDVAAAAEARKYGGSPDFYVMGTAGQKARQLWMFFGPQVQGIDRTIQRYKHDHGRLGLHLAALTAAGVALDAYNASFINPDMDVPEIDLIPLSERRTNLIFMLPGAPQQSSSGQKRQPYIKIPLGHTAQALMTPIMETLAAARGAISPAQVAIDTAGQFVPGSAQIDANDPLTGIGQGLIQGLNPAIKLPVEQLANMNMFNRAPIVGRRVIGNIPSEQYTDKTSPAMVDLGQFIGRVPGFKDTWLASPDRLEHAYRALFPGPGEQLLSLADVGRRPPMAKAGTEWWTSLPGAGPIIRSFLPSQGNQMGMDLRDELFDTATRTQQLVTTLNFLSQTNPAKAEVFSQRPDVQQAEALNPILQDAAKEIAALAREKTRIQYDRTLSVAEKQREIRDIYLMEIEILANIAPTARGVIQ